MPKISNAEIASERDCNNRSGGVRSLIWNGAKGMNRFHPCGSDLVRSQAMSDIAPCRNFGGTKVASFLAAEGAWGSTDVS